MAKFSDLNEQDKIQYIKDGFVLILEQLAKDPSKLKNYITVEKPKTNVAAFEVINDTMSEEQKVVATYNNTILKDKVDTENAKLELEYVLKEGIFKKIEEIISGLKKKEGCQCGACINTNITNGTIPSELEPLIDAARKEAEERSY
jgi:hypothetical protein